MLDSESQCLVDNCANQCQYHYHCRYHISTDTKPQPVQKQTNGNKYEYNKFTYVIMNYAYLIYDI
jgi:hypothetical protein